ncbi:hypothetical protein [Legionella cherrii]|uniref:Dot/Icm T4SS effector n=2 Tax=Legionella cherrii TaxID=28084 RepID=A0ABY6T1V8_9GAMM|nr:hypothetical protein [Legionella cherrii]VEB33233.1 Dot/Icm T4SS effector [Legionella cherrii]
MPRRTSDLKKMLEKGNIDTSDFILIALDILKNENKILEDQPLEEAMYAIKVDYLEVNYSDAVEKLIAAAKTLKDASIAELFEQAAENAAKNSKPEQVESRRYFENKFVTEQWKTLDTTEHQDSLDRLAKFMVGANKLYAEKQDFSKLRKVNNLNDMEMVIAAIRGFGEEGSATTIVLDKIIEMRHEENALSGFKDRGSERNPDDVGYSQNPGIIKANTPMPLVERREKAVQGSITDSFLIKRTVKDGYSAKNVDVPFINSVSGTAYTLAAVLNEYAKENQQSPTLQKDMDNIIQTFVAFTCKSGFHSLSEMMDVLNSPEVSGVFDGYGLKINHLFSKETLETAIAAASDYTETRQSQKSMLSEISQHSLFKRHAEPTAKANYPGEIALRVREEKLTGPRVERALREMYQEGLQGDKKYSPEHCREMAQQFVNYAKKHHRHFNMDGVKQFLKEMNELIKERQEHIEKNVEHYVMPFEI